MKLTELNNVQAFLDEQFPEDLSAFLNTTNSIIPLAKRANGEKYSLKISVDTVRAPRSLGFPTLKAAHSSLRVETQELFQELEKLRNVVYDHDQQPPDEYESGNSRNSEGLIIRRRGDDDNPRCINAILNKASIDQFETVVSCKADIDQFLRYCEKLYPLPAADNEDEYDDDDPEIVQHAETLASKIYRRIGHFSSHGKTFDSLGNQTRLIRKIILNPMREHKTSALLSINCSPEFVLPLSMLCRPVNDNDEPEELQDIALLEMMSPRKLFGGTTCRTNRCHNPAHSLSSPKTWKTFGSVSIQMTSGPCLVPVIATTKIPPHRIATTYGKPCQRSRTSRGGILLHA